MQENNITLKRATQEDAKTLLEIEKTATGLKIYSGYFNEKEIQEWLRHEIVYLIEKNGEIAGSIAYEIKNKNHACISGLVIKPEFQGQGLARKALIEILKELKNFERIDIEVHPDNIKAVNLYESIGFEFESRQENYFGDGEPRIILVLNRQSTL